MVKLLCGELMFIVFWISPIIQAFDFYIAENEAKKLYGRSELIYYVMENEIVQTSRTQLPQKYFNYTDYHFNWTQTNRNEVVFYWISFNKNQSSYHAESSLSIPDSGKLSLHPNGFSVRINCSNTRAQLHVKIFIEFQIENKDNRDKSIKLQIIRHSKCSEYRNPKRFQFLQIPEEINSSGRLGIIICIGILLMAFSSLIIILIQRLFLTKNMGNVILCHRRETPCSKKETFDASLISSSKVLSHINFIENAVNSVGNQNKFAIASDPNRDNDEESFFTSSSVDTHQTGATPIINRRVQDPLQIINEIQVPRYKITLKRLLLEGTFCQMYEATMSIGNSKTHNKIQKVMIKTTTDYSTISQSNVLIRDGILLAGLRHRHLCPVIRAAIPLYQGTDVVQPPWLIYHYAEWGNLKLILHKSTFESSKTPVTFSTPQLIMFAIQLLRAMKYLHSRSIIHRDIAARNCFLNSLGQLKLSDSALSRDIFPEDYHCLGDNENRPVKWLSVEALVQRRFSPSSDIWAFGVFLWELVTRAELPYAEIDPFEMPTVLRSGYRLQQPPNCPDNLWTIMFSCWNADFEKRPKLVEVMKKLKGFQTILTDFV